MELNKEEYVALCKVVDYLHDDELKHYEEWKEDNENSEHHIWNSVKTLSLKLKEYQMITTTEREQNETTN